MDRFNDDLFREYVHEGLQEIQRILDLHRNPSLAHDIDHDYGDKYRLVDQMTNTALIALLNVLSYFGLTIDILKSIDKSNATTLRFEASDSCTFLKEQIVEIPLDKTEEEVKQTQIKGSPFKGNTVKSTIKQVIQNVQEYHWKVDVKWEISIYSGSDLEAKTILKTRSSSIILIISSDKQAPLPDHRTSKPLEVSLTWLLSQINTERMIARFAIDKQSSTTKTPRQNEQVESALVMMDEMSSWTTGIRDYFNGCIQDDILDKHNPAGPIPTPNPHNRLTSLSCDSIFVPIQPILDDSKRALEDIEIPSQSVVSMATESDYDCQEKSVLLSRSDMHKLLNMQIVSIDRTLEELRNMYPSSASTSLLSIEEASLVVLSLHSKCIRELEYLVDYVEHVLAHQLITAIGKSIELSDINQFVRYHNVRLLNPPPKSFCHAIRQTGHDPCGVITIESGDNEPIQTFSRVIESSTSIKLPLNSSTTVELTGQKYLHGWMQHRFGDEENSFRLVARARQFSAFLLVVGTMTGPDTLNPSDAIIVQDKDELMIPLLLEEIPTSKEFKDAIRSLSPEQQRFAKSFRSMQLGSSVMGICVIQIKPQLEVLLGLPEDALLKEMKLTQDLMELLIEYQVPSDLLSYDGTESNASPKEKVANVRFHVKTVCDFISEAKKKELEEQAIQAETERQWRLDRENSIANQMLRWEGSANPMAEVNHSAFVRQAKQRLTRTKTKSKTKTRTRTKTKTTTTPTEENSRNTTTDNLILPKEDDVAIKTASVTREVDDVAIKTTSVTSEVDIDFSNLPQLLDSAIEELAVGTTLRSTIVKLSDFWQVRRPRNLVGEIIGIGFDRMDIKTQRNKAYDLLDALSRSGSLPIGCSELHVLVAVTHCFEKDVICTVIQDNINPIEKLEMSALLLGSTIYGVPPCCLVRGESDLRRLENTFPALLANGV